MAAPDERAPGSFPTDHPTPARMYDYVLGGKDNFAIDREAALMGATGFPEAIDSTRENRRFLYRVVRYLAEEAGIRQFLDLGSGLPSQQNVHEVAQRFQPDARVVYVDIDPIVLAHGRALLADDKSTIVVRADITQPEDILDDPEVRRLIDFDQPLAALMISVPHSIPDEVALRDTLSALLDAMVPGSYLALSQFIGVDRESAEENSAMMRQIGMPWKTRTAEEIADLLRDLEAVPPGLVDVVEWRPDPDQPPLPPAPEPLRPFLGATSKNSRVKEFGGVLRKVLSPSCYVSTRRDSVRNSQPG